MGFRARADLLGAFGVISVSLIVAKREPNEMLGGDWVQSLRRSFKAVFATLPARKTGNVLSNDYCGMQSFGQ
jgi:hypothetical protein